MRHVCQSARAGLIGGAAALALLAAADGAQAADFTVGGAFNDLNDVLLVEFSDSDGALTAFTSQWDGFGGTIAADPPLDGFDAQLQLFDGTGPGATFVTANDDDGTGTSANVGGTTFTGGFFDSLLVQSLAAGDFTLGLTNFNNDPAGTTLAEGYDNAGDPTQFTGPNFRVHLLGIDSIESTEILSVEETNPISVSGPFNNSMM